MTRLLLKLFLFAGLFLVFDKLFIIVANRSAESEVDRRLEYLVNGEINTNIFILGSSRGARGIIAEQIKIKTGCSAYNLCYPGSNVVFHEFLLRTLIKFNDKPEMILLVVDDDTEFKYNSTIIFRKDRLYPLVKYRPIWTELADCEGRSLIFPSMLVLDRLNKYNFDLRQKGFTSLDTINNCGSMPLSWQSRERDWNIDFGERLYSKDNELKEYIDAYKQIINICSINEIKLVIVFPPLLKTHSETFEERIKRLGSPNTDYLIYESSNPAYRNEDLFHDVGHVMREGAEIFTDEIIDYINKNY